MYVCFVLNAPRVLRSTSHPMGKSGFNIYIYILNDRV